MLAVPGHRLAVLGSPIAHSKSPRIHAAAYRALGLDWDYGRDELTERDLAGFLDGLSADWHGLSLTMPLKEEAHRLASELDPIAQRSGVVNTLRRSPDGDGWHGWNTDVFGLQRAIEDLLSGNALAPHPRHVIVLGAGATAVSALLAAEALGAQQITVLARRPERAERLLADLPQPGLQRTAAALTEWPSLAADLVISTLPGTAGDALTVPATLRAETPLFDVAYSPWPSPLAVSWSQADGLAGSGIDMLIWQALAQIRIFVSGDPTQQLPHEATVLGEMRAAGMEE